MNPVLQENLEDLHTLLLNRVQGQGLDDQQQLRVELVSTVLGENRHDRDDEVLRHATLQGENLELGVELQKTSLNFVLGENLANLPDHDDDEELECQ